jgi:hypothetical protein
MKYTARYVKELPLDSLKTQIVRNPNYGGEDSGIHGWPIRPIIYRGIKPDFMEALRESLRKEGYRNPIVVYATDNGNHLAFGGSRVHAGRDVGLRCIPAIVNDYCGRFEEAPEVTEENFCDFFTDPPKFYTVDEYGADYHYALERKRRAEYDDAGFAWADEDSLFIDIDFPWVKAGLTQDPLNRKASRERSKYLRLQSLGDPRRLKG